MALKLYVVNRQHREVLRFEDLTLVLVIRRLEELLFHSGVYVSQLFAIQVIETLIYLHEKMKIFDRWIQSLFSFLVCSMNTR